MLDGGELTPPTVDEPGPILAVEINYVLTGSQYLQRRCKGSRNFVARPENSGLLVSSGFRMRREKFVHRGDGFCTSLIERDAVGVGLLTLPPSQRVTHISWAYRSHLDVTKKRKPQLLNTPKLQVQNLVVCERAS